MRVFRGLVATVYFFEVGLLLLLVPWSGYLHQNSFAEAWPWIKILASNGFVKGMISGIGLINLGAGLAELVGLFKDRHGNEQADWPNDRP
jgi:hypothetical protein